MNNETDLAALKSRIDHLEGLVAALSKEHHLGRPSRPWYQQLAFAVAYPLLVLTVIYAMGGTVIGHSLGLTNHSWIAHNLSTEKVVLRDLDDEAKNYGEIDGRDASIDLRSDEGRVRISPRGIEIDGPDGTVSLKPEKKE